MNTGSLAWQSQTINEDIFESAFLLKRSRLIYDNETIFVSNNQNKYIAIEDLFSDYRKTVLNPNDIVTSINIPIPPNDKKFYAWKVSKRYDQDISTVSMAALIGMGENNIIQSCRICFGGLSATTFRSKEIENTFIGIKPDQDHSKILEITKRSIKPLSDLRGSANY